MRAGGFPSRDEALRREMARRQKMSRRALLGASVVCLTGGLVGGVVVARATEETGVDRSPRPPEPDAQPPKAGPELEWARTLAQGPLSELLKAKYTYVGTVDSLATEDATAWYGIARLGQSFVEASPQTRDPMLGRVLLGLKRRGKTPAYLQPLFDHVERCAEGRPR